MFPNWKRTVFNCYSFQPPKSGVNTPNDPTRASTSSPTCETDQQTNSIVQIAIQIVKLKSKRKVNNIRTLQSLALRLRPIKKSNGVIRIPNRPQHVLLPPSRLVRHNTRLQLSKLVRAAPDSDTNRRILRFVAVVQNLLDAGLSVLERRSDGEVPDDDFLDNVSGLQRVVRPFVGFGAAF